MFRGTVAAATAVVAAGAVLPGAALPGAFIPGCRPVRGTDGGPHAAHLTARPGKTGGITAPGQRPLGLAAERDALLRVPAAVPGAAPDGPLPLLVLLHGAGSDAAAGLAVLAGLADSYGLALLAPASCAGTWDAIRGGYEADVERIDAGLKKTFSAVSIDARRIGIAGFSDGASYALGLGLANGDLFSKVIAFSPGFIPSGPRQGRPAIFVSHGTGDNVLPLRSTSRKIVPSLEQDGYDVTYREFDGGHTVPAPIARDAMDWLRW